MIRKSYTGHRRGGQAPHSRENEPPYPAEQATNYDRRDRYERDFPGLRDNAQARWDRQDDNRAAAHQARYTGPRDEPLPAKRKPAASSRQGKPHATHRLEYRHLSPVDRQPAYGGYPDDRHRQSRLEEASQQGMTGKRTRHGSPRPSARRSRTPPPPRQSSRRDSRVRYDEVPSNRDIRYPDGQEGALQYISRDTSTPRCAAEQASLGAAVAVPTLTVRLPLPVKIQPTALAPIHPISLAGIQKQYDHSRALPRLHGCVREIADVARDITTTDWMGRVNPVNTGYDIQLVARMPVHGRPVMPNGGRGFGCPTLGCSTVRDTKTLIASHWINTHAYSANIFWCDGYLCEEYFLNKTTAHEHRRFAHPKEVFAKDVGTAKLVRGDGDEATTLWISRVTSVRASSAIREDQACLALLNGDVMEERLAYLLMRAMYTVPDDQVYHTPVTPLVNPFPQPPVVQPPPIMCWPEQPEKRTTVPSSATGTPPKDIELPNGVNPLVPLAAPIIDKTLIVWTKPAPPTPEDTRPLHPMVVPPATTVCPTEATPDQDEDIRIVSVEFLMDVSAEDVDALCSSVDDATPKLKELKHLEVSHRDVREVVEVSTGGNADRPVVTLPPLPPAVTPEPPTTTPEPLTTTPEPPTALTKLPAATSETAVQMPTLVAEEPQEAPTPMEDVTTTDVPDRPASEASSVSLASTEGYDVQRHLNSLVESAETGYRNYADGMDAVRRYGFNHEQIQTVHTTGTSFGEVRLATAEPRWEPRARIDQVLEDYEQMVPVSLHSHPSAARYWVDEASARNYEDHVNEFRLPLVDFMRQSLDMLDDRNLWANPTVGIQPLLVSQRTLRDTITAICLVLRDIDGGIARASVIAAEQAELDHQEQLTTLRAQRDEARGARRARQAEQ